MKTVDATGTVVNGYTLASPASDAAQQIWSYAYSTGKWANDGFGDGW